MIRIGDAEEGSKLIRKTDLKNIDDIEYRIEFNEIDLEEFKSYFNKKAWEIIQEVRKNVICYIRPVVGWYNLGININEKLKKNFLRKNEKLKGVVKKDKKKLNILSIKIQVAKLKITQDSTFCQ